jgi:hypothetical protein
MTQSFSAAPGSGVARLAGRCARRAKLLLSAGAIALAAVAAPAGPARAQTADELLAFILGATAVAVIVRSLDSNARPRQRLGANTLPDACLERVRLRGREFDLYHSACLASYGVGRLPQRCEAQIRTNVGVRRYFLAQCLFEANYRPQGGWATAPRVWDSPGIVTRPHLPPRASPHRPHRDRGWHRDRSGRDRGERDWSGRERDERGWSGRDRGDRERERGDSRRGERDRSVERQRDQQRGWSSGGQGSGQAGGHGGGTMQGPGPATWEWTDRGP